MKNRNHPRTATRIALWYGSGFAMVMAVVAGGCSSGGPELGEVEGTVTLDGKPLSDALVSFKPAEGRPSQTRTDGNGHYKVEYRIHEPGARIGTNIVRITTAKRADGLEKKEEVAERVPAKYNRRTTLTAEVKEGSNKINFDLESE